MILNRAGREYAHWPYTADADMTAAAVDIRINGVWYPRAAITSTDITLVVAGPDATANPVGTVVLLAGANRTLVRFPDNPEIVVRDGGTIYVTDDF